MKKSSNTGSHFTTRRNFIKRTAIAGSGLLLFEPQVSCARKIKETQGGSSSGKLLYTIATVSGSRKVMPNDIPEEGKAIRLKAGRNETESFQIVIRPQTDIKNVTVKTGSLFNGTNRINGLEWFQVGYVYVQTFNGHPVSQDVSGQLPGWYPDPLLKKDNPVLIKNWSNCIWVNCSVPAGAAAGIYNGAVEIQLDGQKESIAIELEVCNFDLPVKPGLPTLFSLSFEYLTLAYGSSWSPSVRKAWLDHVAAQRISPTDMYLDGSKGQDQWKITMDEYASYRPKMNGFVIYPVTATWEDRNASAEMLIARFEKSRDYIDAVIASGIAAENNGVFYGFDECEESHFETMKKVHAHIKSIYPNIPIATTSMHIKSAQKMKELNIDILILHIFDNIYNQSLAQSIRQSGGKVWAYISLQPYYPMPNWRIENPLIEARILLSSMAYGQEVDGFLYWGLTQYNKINWRYPTVIRKDTAPKIDYLSITTPTEEYQWLHGDGILIYPGEEGPLNSIRMENIRKGMEDYEYYRLLEQKMGKPVAIGLASKTASSFSAFDRSLDNYLRQKSEIADLLK